MDLQTYLVWLRKRDAAAAAAAAADADNGVHPAVMLRLQSVYIFDV
jgi:hypothetical protein